MTNCLVLGGAQSVFKDVERALDLGEFHGLVTVNDITVMWPGEITAAVSLHGDKWPLWLEQRRRSNRVLPTQVFAHSYLRREKGKYTNVITDYAVHLWPNQKDSGSSGLFGVKVALDELGFDQVVCCGIPMTCEGAHYFDIKPWGGAGSHRRGWVEVKSLLEGRVKSMSGWTAEQLGKPSVEWLGKE